MVYRVSTIAPIILPHTLGDYMKAAFAIFTIFISLSAHAGTYSKILWNKNEISVCFASGESNKRKVWDRHLKIRDWNQEDKINVREWTESEFKPERTGIYFTGWKTCKETPNADIILFYNANFKYFATFNGIAGGYGPIDKVEGYPKAKSLVVISKSGMNKSVVLHEFGHVAGLAHEHQHPDALKESKKPCLLIDTRIWSQFNYEHFDEESIMSYCNRALTSLSTKEVDLLKRLYPDNHDDRLLLEPSLY